MLIALRKTVLVAVANLAALLLVEGSQFVAVAPAFQNPSRRLTLHLPYRSSFLARTANKSTLANPAL